ncbi:MAG: hypothetical protein WCA12_14670 [Burkholderiales bacterium]
MMHTALDAFRRVAFALAALAVVGLAACAPEMDWREFQWPEGGFSVLLPGKPRKQVRTVALDGAEISMQMLSYQTSGMAYGIGYSDFPSGADAATKARRLAAARDQLVANIAGELTEDREMRLEAHPGRDFRARGNVAGTDFVISARVFAVGDRLYQVALVSRATDLQRADPDLFLGSFKLLR